MKNTNLILEDIKEGIFVGKKEVIVMMLEDVQELIQNTVYSLLKFFLDNCMQILSIHVSKLKKYKMKIVHYLFWVNKMKVVLQAN